MNKVALAEVLRNQSSLIRREIDSDDPRKQEKGDTAELILVLARIVEGKTIKHAFGAPGDWGYDTLIGSALAAEDR